MEAGSFSPIHLSWLDAIARMGVALGLSLLLGFERYAHHKPVDFRPFAIIALASSSLIIGIIEFTYRAADPKLSIDPAKIVSGIMTGIGFLGAGTLFREKHVVQGAGSAASIWAAGAIGIACGLGMLWLAGLLAAGVLATLVLSRPIIRRYAVDAEKVGRDEDRP